MIVTKFLIGYHKHCTARTRRSPAIVTATTTSECHTREFAFQSAELFAVSRSLRARTIRNFFSIFLSFTPLLQLFSSFNRYLRSIRRCKHNYERTVGHSITNAKCGVGCNCQESVLSDGISFSAKCNYLLTPLI